MTMYEVTPSKCPNCGHKLDGATAVIGEDDIGPSAGDLTICLNCSHPLIFKPDLTVRALTEADFQAMSSEEKTVMMKACVATTMARATAEREGRRTKRRTH